MYRKELPKQELYVLFCSGLGDCVARLPVIPFILDNHPQIYITLWVPSFFKVIARKSLPVTEKLVIRTYDEKDKAKNGIPVKKFTENVYTNLARHMTIHAFDMICNTQPDDIKYYNYLKLDLKGVYVNRFNLPKKYVVITCGYTAKVREFKPLIVNQVVDFVIGKGYTPVFLGKEITPENSDASKVIKGNFSDMINYDKGVNLINQCDLLESAKIIKDSKCIIGLDNGLLHLAAMTNVAIVGSFSTVKSVQRLPFRHDEMGWNYYTVELTEKDLACIHCQSNMNFTFLHNFINCYHNDYKCLDMLTADKYKKELEKIL